MAGATTEVSASSNGGKTESIGFQSGFSGRDTPPPLPYQGPAARQTAGGHAAYRVTGGTLGTASQCCLGRPPWRESPLRCRMVTEEEGLENKFPAVRHKPRDWGGEVIQPPFGLVLWPVQTPLTSADAAGVRICMRPRNTKKKKEKSQTAQR